MLVATELKDLIVIELVNCSSPKMTNIMDTEQLTSHSV